MRHMVRITVAVMVASLLAGVTLSADGNELRIRRRQLVITSAMANCDAGTLIASGRNVGSQPPHVTLALAPLLNVTSPTIEGVFQADLPAGFCVNPGPGSYLLTVMRTRMRHRHRWLKHTKKDLALFEVAIGAVTLDEFDVHTGDASAHHSRYTNAEAIAAVDLPTHAGMIAVHHLPYGDSDAISAVADNISNAGIVKNEIDTLIAAHAAIGDAHHAPGGGGGGGGPISILAVSTDEQGTGDSTGEVDLFTFNLDDPHKLAANGEAIEIEAWGTVAAGFIFGEKRQVTLKFGTEVVADSTLRGMGIGTIWRLTATIIRAGEDSQVAIGTTELLPATGTGPFIRPLSVNPAEDDDVLIPITVTGKSTGTTAINTDRVVLKGVTIRRIDAP